MYRYPAIFDWRAAFGTAIAGIRSESANDAPAKAIVQVWEAYRKIVNSDEHLTIGAAQRKFGELRTHLELAKNKLAEGNSQEPHGFQVLFERYDYLWNLMERELPPEDPMPQIPEPECLVKVHSWMQDIADRQNSPERFDELHGKIKRDWKEGEISYIDFLALKASAEKYRSWALEADDTD